MRTIAVLIGRFALVCCLSALALYGARAEEKRARVDTVTDGGFGRLIFTTPNLAEADARMENGALTIAFAEPLKADVVHAARRLTAYVKHASAEPGLVRLTLAPKVRANVMAAGDKLFVDLVPESWKGAPPRLPKKLLADLQAAARGKLNPDPAPVGAIGRPGLKVDPAGLKVEAVAASGETRITFPFAAPTPAALFRRGDAVFALFETERALDIRPLALNKPIAIRGIELTAVPGGRLLRLKLADNRHASISALGTSWVLTISEREPQVAVTTPVERLATKEGSRAVLIPLAEPSRAFRITDPASDEKLVVVTTRARTDGLGREQDFVEFKLMASGQGLALAPRADDLAVQVMAQSVIVSRASGLSVSAALSRRD
jgi:hypothetical protein